MPRDLRLALAADLSELVGDSRLLSPSVGPAGEAIFLLADAADAPVVQGRELTTGAAFPHGQTQRPVAADIVVHNGRRVVRRVTLTGLPLAHPNGCCGLAPELDRRCWRAVVRGAGQACGRRSGPR